MRHASSHPDEMTTAAYIDGALAERERERFETHLVSCDACRTGIALLTVGDDELAAAPREWVARARSVETVTAPASGRFRGWIAAAAAAAILLFGWVALRLPGPPASLPTYRSEAETSLVPLHPVAGSRVAIGTLRFRWSPVAGADRYRVTLRSATGEPLGTFEVPGESPELVWEGVTPPTGTLLWTVEALSLDRVIGASRPTPFELR